MPQNEVQGVSSIGSLQSAARHVYFTGYQNDDSTALTTTAMPDSAVVCFTEPGGKKGRGIDVTKPQTALINQFAGIVVAKEHDLVGTIAVAGNPYGITAGNLIPGWLNVVSAASAIQALTKSNMTKPSTAIVLLGPVNASWNLETVAFAATATGLSQAVAMALETVDTSTTAAVKWVRLGGIFGGLET